MTAGKTSMATVALWLAGVIGIQLCAQIPTREERIAASSLNPEYYALTWRAAYLDIDRDKPETPDAVVCYRKDFELSSAPRRAALTVFTRYAGRHRFTINGHELMAPRPNRIQVEFVNFDITPYLQAGRNVITYQADRQSWLAVEGIAFLEDGGIQRIVTAGFPESGWRGGWNMPEGWDDPARDGSDLPAIPGTRLADRRMRSRLGVVPCPPYYGPIEVEPIQPNGPSLAHPIIDAEDAWIMNVRLLNLQGAAGHLALTVERMDLIRRRVLDRNAVALTPDGTRDLVGRIAYPPQPQGVYRLRFILTRDGEEEDRRDVEVAVVGEIPQRVVQGTHYEDGLELKEIWSVDCTEEPDPETFLAARSKTWQEVETRVVESAAGRYRALAENHEDLYFAYRFKVQTLFVPHLVVVEWPDDTQRDFIAHVVEGTSMMPAHQSFDRHRGEGFQRAEATVVSSYDRHPERSNKMQKLHLLYWPNEEEAAIHLQTIGGESAAAARITVYEITNDLPALQVADYGDRMIGPHTERGATTMPSIYYSGPLGALFRARLLTRLHPEYYRNWYTTTENLIKRLRFTGQNLYLMGHFAYEGTLYPVKGAHRIYTQDTVGGGEVIGDYTDLILRMFARNGIYMVSAVEHFGSPVFSGRRGHGHGVPTVEEMRAGAPTHLTVDRNGDYIALHGASGGGALGPNYLHPDIQEGVLEIVGQLADLYGDYPAWRGVAFVLSSAVWGPMSVKHFWDVRADPLHVGYEDWTIAEFERDTGHSIPTEPDDPGRFNKRYHWMMAHARQEWIDWRADRFTQLYRAMRDRLVAKAPHAKLYLCSGEPLMGAMEKAARDMEGHYDDADHTRALLKTYGFDVAALQAEPGLVVNYMYNRLEDHPGRRETARNQGFQNVFANDGKGGAWVSCGLPHFGHYRGIPEGRWLFTRNATRQGFYFTTHVNEVSVNVMARSNPTWMPHEWADVSESTGRLHERRLFARAYRTLPNGTYERMTGNGLDRNIWVSRTVIRGVEYVYAANLHWWELDVELTFAAGARVHDLINDQPVALADGVWPFRLPPYSIQTFRVQRRGLLRRLRGASALRSGTAAPEEDVTRSIKANVEKEINVTRILIDGARRRAEKEPGVTAYPGWRGFDYLERNLECLEHLRDEQRWSDAYNLAGGGGLAATRDLLVSEALQAMPLLVLGPFGEESDTDAFTAGGGRKHNPEVVSDYRGMETAFIGESTHPDGAELISGFTPDLSRTYTVYPGREITWYPALKTSDLALEHPVKTPGDPRYWMIVYAYTEIYSPEERDAQVSVGSLHAISVYVNDALALKHGGFGSHRGGQRPARADQDRAPVRLKAGWNRVLIKSVQGTGVLNTLFLSVADSAGNALTDLRYRVPEA